MRKYRVIFYKDKWSEKDGITPVELRKFFVYGNSYDEADRIAQQKLEEYKARIRDSKVTYWMEAIGQRVYELPFEERR